MRLSIQILFSLYFLMGCSGGGSNDDEGINSFNLGSFEGDFQVVDVPQTSLGFINNAKVNFQKTGDRFIMTVSGDDGFNRVFEGEITGEGANSSFLMRLEKQLSPIEKAADGTLSIVNNIASIEINVANDVVTLKKLDGNGDKITFELAGKLRISENFERTE